MAPIPRSQDGTIPDWYLPAVQRLATAVLTSWSLSDEPTGGEWWDTYCTVVGVDSETFGERVTALRSGPRFKCGHMKTEETTYRNPRGGDICRQCLAAGGRARVGRRPRQ